jgi:hypothetical protein
MHGMLHPASGQMDDNARTSNIFQFCEVSSEASALGASMRSSSLSPYH